MQVEDIRFKHSISSRAVFPFGETSPDYPSAISISSKSHARDQPRLGRSVRVQHIVPALHVHAANASRGGSSCCWCISDCDGCVFRAGSPTLRCVQAGRRQGARRVVTAALR